MTGGRANGRVHDLRPEPLKEADFRAFGQILLSGPGEPHFRGVGTHAWIMDFEADGATQVMTLRSWYQGLSFSMLERHFAVTQTFIATGGSPSVVALAPPGDPDDRERVPEPEEVRAFVIDPGTGYLLHRGTWHSLDRFPLYPPDSTFAVVTTAETTDELKDAPSDRWAEATSAWFLTQMYDYQEQRGISFRFVL